MPEFRKILFPVTSRRPRRRSSPYVSHMAERHQGRVHLLFVARVFDYFTSMYVPHPSVTQLKGRSSKGPQKRLYEFAEEHFKEPPPARVKVVAGDPRRKSSATSRRRGSTS